jgi:Legionella pneumophila major outer membrane protein precursor
MRKQARRSGMFDVAGRIALATAATLGVVSSTRAEEGKWSMKLGAAYLRAYGHDQHVLTVHEIDVGPPRVETTTGVNLETEGEIAYLAEFRYHKGPWGLGLDVFWYDTAQSTPARTAAAAGPIDEVVFQVADQRFTSSNPSQVLFYEVLPDTDLIFWTVDLYGTRILAGNEESDIRLLAGVRFADFDNDYRAVVGVRDVGGWRIAASSNYGRMTGPLLGLSGELRRGRSSLRGTFSQSVVIGSTELSNKAVRFTGPFTFVEDEEFVPDEVFHAEQDVAIPITELRAEWDYQMWRSLSLSLGVQTAVWWDVPVPPGVIPGAGGDKSLHENTIVFLGGRGGVKLTF